MLDVSDLTNEADYISAVKLAKPLLAVMLKMLVTQKVIVQKWRPLRLW